MKITHTVELRLWLTSPGDLDKLYDAAGTPSLYHTGPDIDMVDQGWVDLGVHKLTFAPPPREKLVGTALERLQAQLQKFDEETANARMALLSRINNLLALPCNQP